MLVLTRKPGEQIHIGQDIVITVVRLRSGTVGIGIEAPRQVHVLRGELVGAEPAGVQPAEAVAVLGADAATTCEGPAALAVVAEEAKAELAGELNGWEVSRRPAPLDAPQHSLRRFVRRRTGVHAREEYAAPQECFSDVGGR